MCRDLSRFFVAYRPRRLDATGAFCLCRGIKGRTIIIPMVGLVSCEADVVQERPEMAGAIARRLARLKGTN